jgi:hypothetical protein
MVLSPKRALLPAEIASLHADPYQMFAPRVWRRYFIPPAGGGSTPISATDSATGTDAASVAISSTSAETAAGVDAVALERQSTSADTASGVDAVSLERQSTVAETGSGLDATALQRQSTVTDAAAGAEAATVAIAATVADTGAAVDTTALERQSTVAETAPADAPLPRCSLQPTRQRADAASVSTDTQITAIDTARADATLGATLTTAEAGTGRTRHARHRLTVADTVPADGECQQRHPEGGDRYRQWA